MIRALRVIAAGIATIATILAVTVLSAFCLILLGFRGNATFPADCALVFGAAISGTDMAGPAIVRRVAGAAALWKEGKVHTLILSGGKGDSWQMSEGAVMRKEAIRDGVDGRDIFIEDSARSTKENLANSRILVEKHCATVVAVSDRYHLARIRLLAKRAGWGSLPTYGVPDRPAQERESRSVARELAAYMYYALGADNFMTLDEYDDVINPRAGSGA
jgi:vancomycin permeability regulator SanA